MNVADAANGRACPNLRVGVVLESLDVPAWQLSLLNTLRATEAAEIALAVVPATPEKSSPYALHRIALSLVSRFLPSPKPGAADACASVSANGFLRDVPQVRPDAQDAPLFTAGQSLRAFNLDLIVSLAHFEACREWSSQFPLGAWYFEANGAAISRTSAVFVGLLELLRRKSHLSTRLRVITSSHGAAQIAYETHSPVDYMSLAATRNQHLWKCAAIPGRVLDSCRRAGKAKFLQMSADPTGSASTVGATGSGMLAGLMLCLATFTYAAWRLWRKLLRSVYSERWMLMSGDHAAGMSSSEFKEHVPPPGRFWADPHVVESDDCQAVFFEDASQVTGIGHISVADVSDDGRVIRPRKVLAKPYHLSYPFVFRWQGQHYLVPESASNRTVELYRCTKFPDEWLFSHNLMEGIAAYDATLFEHEGVWWMFANVKEREECSSWDELHLFWAASPVSTHWTRHVGNPVISDVRRARPAGPLFTSQGRIFRPSQDSSRRYGHALNINEVLVLNKDAYREVPVRQLKPGADRRIRAIHTLSHGSKVTFIDAIIRESRSGGSAVAG